MATTESEPGNMESPTREISVDIEIENTSSSLEKDQKEKEIEDPNFSSDPEEMAMSEEINESQQEFGIPDPAPSINANNVLFQETQLTDFSNRPHYSRDNTAATAISQTLPTL